MMNVSVLPHYIVLLSPCQEEDQVSVSVVLTLSRSVVQLSMQGSKLVVATWESVVMCDTKLKTFVEVGAKARHGCYGAALDGKSNLICARPGFRLWRCGLDGWSHMFHVFYCVVISLIRFIIDQAKSWRQSN